MMMHRKKILSAFLSICAAVMLTAPVSAESASVDDVFQALENAGMPDAFIQDTRNLYQTAPHDENGMELNGQYRSYDEWVAIINQDGAVTIMSAIADAFGIPAEELLEHYNMQTQPPESGQDTPVTTTEFVPSVEPEQPFADMTLDEKRAYIAGLPEDERAAFLANLTPEERNSILKQLEPEKKEQIVGGLIEIGQEMGLNVTVENIDDLRFNVRDENGTLIDAAGFGLTVDPTGWNTTVPVLAGSGMILLSLGGLMLLYRMTGKQEDTQHG